MVLGVVAAVALALAAPAYAAPSGAIDGGVANADWSQGTAAFSVTYDQCGTTCEWWAVATKQPVEHFNDSCVADPYVAFDPGSPNWIWGSVPQTANGTISSGTMILTLGRPGFRLCLYAATQAGKTVVATKHIDPAPTVPPPGTENPPAPLPRLTTTVARHRIRTVLRREYGAAYRKGTAKRIGGCRRISRLRIRCGKVSWVRGARRHSGWVSIWRTRAGGGMTWDSVHRIRTR